MKPVTSPMTQSSDATRHDDGHGFIEVVFFPVQPTELENPKHVNFFRSKLMLLLGLLLALGYVSDAPRYDFEVDGGALPGDSSLETCWANGAALNETLKR